MTNYEFTEEKLMAAAERTSEKKFWKDALSGNWEYSSIPVDSISNTDATRSACVQIALPDELISLLATFSHTSPARLHIILMSGLGLLMQKYNRRDIFLLGTPIYRQEPAGDYLNTVLPVMFVFDGACSFRELLRKTQHTMQEAINHQNFPVEILAGDYSKNNTDALFPLFDISLALEPLQQSVSLQHIPHRIMFGFSVPTTGTPVSLQIHYDPNSYQAETMTQLGAYYKHLLHMALQHPDQDISALTLADNDDMLAWIRKVNPVVRRVEGPCHLAALFNQQSIRFPERIAVSCKGATMTYEQLEQETNKLAAYLQAKHVGWQDRVAVLLESSVDFVVAILGILKTGAVYVPVSPSYPVNRIQYILEDSSPAAVITTPGFRDKVPERKQVVMIGDYKEAALAPLNKVVADGDDLAYIIYTSGSTGMPKGVMVSHRNVVNLVHGLTVAIYDRLAPEPLNICQLAPFEFDASVQQIFCSLLSGHALYIVSEEDRTKGDNIIAFYREHRISVSDGTPAHIRLLLESLRGGNQMPGLRQMIIAGEAFPATLAKAFLEYTASSGLQLSNLYGPTEACVDATVYDVIPDRIPPAAVLPIGRPLANQCIYILDEHLNVQPPGIAGEIYIGGEGVSRGYQGKKELTLDRFLPDPFRAGKMMYRSGDKARWMNDGNILFLGRLDEQVKINGYRIEPAEIVSQITQASFIRAACVTANGQEEDRQLTAYVVPDEREALLLSRLLQIGEQGGFVELPDKISLFAASRKDAGEVYEEVFGGQAAWCKQLRLPQRPVILDVGANIGIFSIFVTQLRTAAQIYAFEPVPQIFGVLKKNMALYGISAQLFNIGVANENGAAGFTYYPESPAMSGRFAKAEEDGNLLRQIILNKGGHQLSEEETSQLLKQRLEMVEVTCNITTIRDIIVANQLTVIDLLKIDVEKGEWDVLLGIGDSDWAIIRQIIIEVHDIDDRLLKITALLQEKGFSYEVTQDTGYENTGLYNVYAVRPVMEGYMPLRFDMDAWRTSLKGKGPIAVTDILRSRLEKSLPPYMLPADYIWVADLPLMSNGKTDLRGLTAMKGLQVVRNEDEWGEIGLTGRKIRAIWENVLKKDGFGPNDSFFTIGGNSVKAIQVASRIHHQLQVKATLTDIFKYPTIKELATAMDARADKDELLIPIAPAQASHPLSGAQRRFLTAHYVQEENTSYNLPFFVEINGPLDVDRLKQAFGKLTNRHESLRTCFEVAGQPAQKIVTGSTLTIGWQDMSTLLPEQVAADIQVRTAAFIRPFDLTVAPLMRVDLVKYAANRHLLLVDMHHIISDGFSFQVFLKDLVALYEGKTLPPLRIQYKDFAVWENGEKQQQKLRNQEQYWLAQFSGEIPVLSLEGDYPPSRRVAGRGSVVQGEFSVQRSAELRKLMEKENVTFFALTFTLYSILLSKLSRQQDIVIGTPLLGRRHPDLEMIMGAFVNTLAIRTRPENQKTFESYLREVKQLLLKGFENQDYQFEQLVEAVAPFYDKNRPNPLFSVWFAVQQQDTQVAAKGNQELTFDNVHASDNSTQFDLSLTMIDRPDEIKIILQYNNTVFKEDTAWRFIDYLKILADCICKHPEMPVGQFEFSSALSHADTGIQDIKLRF
ncbi:non-ribosomal peptide synthetase [Chitinophaga qingshengii]|uniref:Amino acid adenylation domain-containing protein n=1 Tax=Chitinophaga qingshengii TaxID=1569794 RepID=A0ABR7TFV4_9BACT|nr:non-ribosomal peptide synthetase [Chitinophaga qingshengii]MBC9929271.1 amino acid adenylation domain-containing protein [Chitinophaga qingshengii]